MQYPGCQRLFMRGFWFRLSLKKWPAPEVFSRSFAARVFTCGRRSSSSHVRKNLWYPGYPCRSLLKINVNALSNTSLHFQGLEKKKILNFSLCSGQAALTFCLPGAGLFLFIVVDDLVNPLGPTSDQHQFSPNNISRSSRVKVMRITKLITKGRMLWS